LRSFIYKPSVGALKRKICYSGWMNETATKASGSEALARANEQLKQVNLQLAEEIDDHRRTEARLRESEEKLQNIILAEPTWVNICDTNGKILEVNPAGIEIMEADSCADLIGRTFVEFVNPEYMEMVSHCRTDVCVGAQHSLEVEVTTLKGNSRWLEVNTVLLPGGENREVQIMSTIYDQTERKDARERLLHQQTELARVMRLNTLGEMATGLAHELNQPLAAISNYLSGCERRIRNDRCSKEDMLEILGLASEQTRRAGNILNEVKHFLKYENFETRDININEVIEGVIKLFKAAGQNSGIDLIMQLEEDLPLVTANHVQLEQVLINLLRNGIDAMLIAGVDSGALTIKSERIDNNGVSVSVQDQGSGIPIELKEQIFKPFFTTKKEGMGMGLAICSSIIESHGGSLYGDNCKQGGSVFRFNLPIAGS